MKRLSLLVAALAISCGSPLINSVKNIPPKQSELVQLKVQPKEETRLGTHPEITYDSCHFKFNTPHGEFEHAELYEDGKRYLCFESLKPTLPFFYGRKVTLYDNDWGSKCDGEIDQIAVGFGGWEYPRPKDPLQTIYFSEFLTADYILNQFHRDYSVKQLRKEWLKRKDNCKNGLCSFIFEKNKK